MSRVLPKYEVERKSVNLTVNLVKDLHPYLVEEAHRRGLPVDTVATQILDEYLARKRNQSRNKKRCEIL